MRRRWLGKRGVEAGGWDGGDRAKQRNPEAGLEESGQGGPAWDVYLAGSPWIAVLASHWSLKFERPYKGYFPEKLAERDPL